MALSPYPGLKSNVSLQSWGHQVFVDSATDPRVDRFINDLRLNSAVTPEFGASCTNPHVQGQPVAAGPVRGGRAVGERHGGLIGTFGPAGPDLERGHWRRGDSGAGR